MAVDSHGVAYSTTDPTATAPTWAISVIDSSHSLNALSCAPAGGPCLAVDDNGQAFVNAQPSSSTSWSGASIDAGRALTGVACPSATLCLAVDAAGNVLTTQTPGSGGWASATIDLGHQLTSVACSSPTLCAAVDDAGQVFSSAAPSGGPGAWRAQHVDFASLAAVSCAATGVCAAVDGAGQALASGAPTTAPSTWSLTPIDDEPLTALSCAASGLCVTGDDRGKMLASESPTAATPSWSPASADTQAILGVSCLSSGFCLAVDAGGRSLGGRVPPPAATTSTPAEVTTTGATLAGVVDPNGAALESCRLEYGTTLPYTQSAPCAVSPSPTGGAQEVSAPVSGLAANSAYHYRVIATSASGTSAGADVIFSTPTSSQVPLVHPHPTIAGTPAPGQRLTCHPGTPAGTPASLAYAWLRDLIPIAGSTGSSYTVKGQDSGHHLQCQVTATDGGGSATAKSAFVTVPVGGVPSSSGETLVGRAVYRRGRLGVPVLCSLHADNGCRLLLRLVVSVHRRTVTLAAAGIRMAAGAHRTVTLKLGRAARRLLASHRRLKAYLYVSGTVIGVIEGQLSRQLVTLGASSHGASLHRRARG